YRGRLFQRENFQGVDVWRTFVYVPPNPKGFYRAINYLSYTFMSIIAGILCGPKDVILCVNPPITVGFSDWLVSLPHRTPMVYNIQDIWPDCIAIIGQLRNRLLFRIFQYLEKFLYKISARLTVLSHGMKQNLLNKGVRENKVTIIPNWADVDYIHPLPKENGFRAANGLNGHFVVMFAGNLGFIAVLNTVLDAAKLLQDDARILFVIIGSGNAKPDLIERAKALNLTNIRFLSTQPKEVLPQMLAAADISLVTLDRRLGQLNVPSKTYNIMASSRPVLAAVPLDSEIARLVQEAGCGVCVPPEDPKSMARAIKDLLSKPGELERYGKNGRSYVVANYSRPMLIRRYRELLREVSVST
ncbi:MAG: glycosyltransferase family 4 protein, partial [Desulfobulbaceae bacterium]|nr:glycosyltransferase family 4 protein [Desulfobulbaceae bacterium]